MSSSQGVQSGTQAAHANVQNELRAERSRRAALEADLKNIKESAANGGGGADAKAGGTADAKGLAGPDPDAAAAVRELERALAAARKAIGPEHDATKPIAAELEQKQAAIRAVRGIKREYNVRNLCGPHAAATAHAQ